MFRQKILKINLVTYISKVSNGILLPFVVFFSTSEVFFVIETSPTVML